MGLAAATSVVDAAGEGMVDVVNGYLEGCVSDAGAVSDAFGIGFSRCQ